ncbi:hypothetical protein NXS19_012139 [Fusarium pseudograminearum]|nr:hypothetical protein NXS19_012139 [Fusarium pseudograminearum]
MHNNNFKSSHAFLFGLFSPTPIRIFTLISTSFDYYNIKPAGGELQPVGVWTQIPGKEPVGLTKREIHRSNML